MLSPCRKRRHVHVTGVTLGDGDVKICSRGHGKSLLTVFLTSLSGMCFGSQGKKTYPKCGSFLKCVCKGRFIGGGAPAEKSGSAASDCLVRPPSAEARWICYPLVINLSQNPVPTYDCVRRGRCTLPCQHNALPVPGPTGWGGERGTKVHLGGSSCPAHAKLE